MTKLDEQFEKSDLIRNKLLDILQGEETHNGLLALTFVMAQTIVATSDPNHVKQNTESVYGMVKASVEMLTALEEMADDTITKH